MGRQGQTGGEGKGEGEGKEKEKGNERSGLERLGLSLEWETNPGPIILFHLLERNVVAGERWLDLLIKLNLPSQIWSVLTSYVKGKESKEWKVNESQMDWALSQGIAGRSLTLTFLIKESVFQEPEGGDFNCMVPGGKVNYIVIRSAFLKLCCASDDLVILLKYKGRPAILHF